ncbi:MAG TPA: hypothetical protein DIS90_02440 [Cytophagales bacterium]|nr:hypothetical protein [Cytophagales bacterium]
MLKQIWNKVSYNGLGTVKNSIELQSLLITNRILAISLVLCSVIGVLLGLRQWNYEPVLVLSFSLLFLFLMVLMHLQYFNTVRLTLCTIIPLLVVGMSIVSKIIPDEEVTDSEYFDYRYVLIAASIIPPLVFGFSRKWFLFIGILPFLFAFVFFDWFHNILNVGYYQIDHSLPSYQISQWIATIMFLVILTGVLVLRRTSDTILNMNSILIRNLNEANNQLEVQRTKIEKANARISYQNEELNRINGQLVNKVSVTNSQLEESNTELVKHNNELQQFSYTISHNLRGPVASILGLINLIKAHDPEQSETLVHLHKAAKSLDETITDLGRIIDIRNDIFKIRQQIHLHELIDEILLTFKKDIEQRNALIECNIDSKTVYNVKPMLSSILYNLISNALKYSDDSKNPLIQINCSERDGEFLLEVRDNGIGIDLTAYGHDLFKLYKRFHYHIEGKGLGLYLIKLQVEALGGNIEVDSKPSQYTSFVIRLPKASNLEHQVLFDESFAEIFFDAPRNMLGIRWKRQISSSEFRLVMARSQEFMKGYNALHWYIDTRNRGTLPTDDQDWLFNDLLPGIFKLGLKRLVIIHAEDVDSLSYNFYRNRLDVFSNQDVEVYFAQSPDEALSWYQERKVVNH